MTPVSVAKTTINGTENKLADIVDSAALNQDMKAKMIPNHAAQTYEDHLEAVRRYNLTRPEYFEVPLTRKRFLLEDRRVFSRDPFRAKFTKGKLVDSRGTAIDTSRSRWNFVFLREGVFLCESNRKAQDRTVSHGVLALGAAVFAAGEIVVEKGKVVYIDNRTGAYRLPPVLLEQFSDHLMKQGVIGKNFVLNCHTRDVMFLTRTEIRMFEDAAIPVTDRHLRLLKIGSQEISNKLVQLQQVGQQTGRDELLDLQAFFIKVRHLDELAGPVSKAMMAIVENEYLSVSTRARFLYELYRNARYLDGDYVRRELERIQTEKSLDEKLVKAIATTLVEIASSGPLDV